MNYFTRKSLIIVLLSSVLTTVAQNLNPEIETTANDFFKANEPGGVVLLSKQNQIIYKKAFGLANVELEVPMKTNMVFEIGSLTKQFTAVAILQLREKNKINLNDPITKYLPDYPKQGEQITIHHLLTHSSGIPNYTNMPGWYSIWRQDTHLTKIIDLFKNEPLDFNPGEQFSYTNSGYVLLGLIIEKVSGMKYEEYLYQNIIKPAGLSNTLFGSRDKIIKNRAHGYQIKEGLINAEYLSFSQPHAAGALMTTVDDFIKWENALKNHSLLSAESLKLATTNHKANNGKPLNYGYGWMINQIYDSPTVEHGGGIFGFSSYALQLPEQDISILVFTNSNSFNPAALATKLATLATGKIKIPKTSAIVNPETAKKWVGHYKFEDQLTRTITYENMALYSQLPGGTKTKLLPLSDTEFAFEASTDASMRFEEKNNTVTAYLRNRIQVMSGNRIIPEEQTPEAIKLTSDLLQNYVGGYTITPNLTFTISLEDQQLFLQFPGQPKIEIFATDESNFFAKLVDAKFKFEKNQSQKVISVTIKQNGQTIIANKND